MQCCVVALPSQEADCSKICNIDFTVWQLCTCSINHNRSGVTQPLNTEYHTEAFFFLPWLAAIAVAYRCDCRWLFRRQQNLEHTFTSSYMHVIIDEGVPIYFYMARYVCYFTQLRCPHNESLQDLYQGIVKFSAPAIRIIWTEPPPLAFSRYLCPSEPVF